MFYAGIILNILSITTREPPKNEASKSEELEVCYQLITNAMFPNEV